MLESFFVMINIIIEIIRICKEIIFLAKIYLLLIFTAGKNTSFGVLISKTSLLLYYISSLFITQFVDSSLSLKPCWLLTKTTTICNIEFVVIFCHKRNHIFQWRMFEPEVVSDRYAASSSANSLITFISVLA